MSLLPLLIGYVLMQGSASGGSASPGKRGKRSPGWPSPKHPPPSGLMAPPSPLAPMPPPAPSADTGTPMSDLHQEAQESPQHAHAVALYKYLTTGSPNWGFPGRPSAPIKSHQTGMQGLVNDGIYGPKTQARCASLLGTPCPTRPGAKAAAASAVKNAAGNKAKQVLSKGVPKLHFP